MFAISIIQIVCLVTGLILSITMDVVFVFGKDVVAFTMIVLGIISLVGQFFIKNSDSKGSKLFIISNALTIVTMVLFSLLAQYNIFIGFEFVWLEGKVNVFNVPVWVYVIECLISICCSLSLTACFLSIVLSVIHKLKIKFNHS
ncbi:MAG TPA: hypothetical protein DD404_04100 [Ruminococcaceae bacterium]|nr:hypothetical protein [Oscillospiraceae bacterium]